MKLSFDFLSTAWIQKSIKMEKTTKARQINEQIFKEFNTYVNYFISSREIANDRKSLETMEEVIRQKLQELSKTKKK